jgi:hypothetical protein
MSYSEDEAVFGARGELETIPIRAEANERRVNQKIRRVVPSLDEGASAFATPSSSVCCSLDLRSGMRRPTNATRHDAGREGRGA